MQNKKVLTKYIIYNLLSLNMCIHPLIQVKELGATVQQCGCLAGDLGKIFDAYWYLATPDASVPSVWPSSYNTVYNARNPMPVNFNGTTYNTVLSVSITLYVQYVYALLLTDLHCNVYGFETACDFNFNGDVK